MADYKQPASIRMRKSSDVAEKQCMKFLDINNVSYHKLGFDCWDVPPQKFIMIPKKIRSLPDFICMGKSPFFCESKAFKGYLKLKHDDLDSYDYWHKHMKLFFYIYDVENKIEHFIAYKDIFEKILTAETDVYPENNKKYYKIEL